MSQITTRNWKKLRVQVFKAQGGECYDCGTKIELTLHHMNYQPPVQCKMDINHPPERGTWETEADVVGLCWDCHKKRHIAPNGEFYADPQGMAAEWFEWFLDQQQ